MHPELFFVHPRRTTGAVSHTSESEAVYGRATVLLPALESTPISVGLYQRSLSSRSTSHLARSCLHCMPRGQRASSLVSKTTFSVLEHAQSSVRPRDSHRNGSDTP